MSSLQGYGAGPQPSPYPGRQDRYEGLPQAGPRSYLQGGPAGFAAAIRDAFANAVHYTGRASRSAYWWYVLFDFVALIVLEAADIGVVAVSRGSLDPGLEVFSLLAFSGTIFLVMTQIALTVRRLHDTGRSGWWYVLIFVPFGGIVVLVWTLTAGDPGLNRFG